MVRFCGSTVSKKAGAVGSCCNTATSCEPAGSGGAAATCGCRGSGIKPGASWLTTIKSASTAASALMTTVKPRQRRAWRDR